MSHLQHYSFMIVKFYNLHTYTHTVTGCTFSILTYHNLTPSILIILISIILSRVCQC